MLLLRTFAPVVLLAFLGHHVSFCSVRRSDKSASSAPGGAQSGDKSAAPARGKFVTKDKMQCTWSARDFTDAVKVRVKCEDPEARIKGGVTETSCDYDGKPQKCPRYQSDPRGFWRQVGRGFKRLQAKLCQDDRALVRAGMCKRAPRDAHFKLDIGSSVSAAQSPGWDSAAQRPPRPVLTSTSNPSNCSTRATHQKTAEEYCSSRWASVCAFFLSVLQTDDC